MNYFVVFSLMIIAACVIVLLLPSNQQEGFALQPEQYPSASTAQTSYLLKHPMAAGQSNLSRTASTADGISSNQHLLDNLIRKHDGLAEAFENRDANKSTANAVSATTTKKNGIASTGASINKKGVGHSGDHVTIPKTGCNKNKCVEFKNPTDALDGNCINPMVNGEPDYSTKYCPAFQPKDDTTYDQECETCGYYKYTADCLKHADPKNKTKCTLYGKYKYNQPPDGATYYSGPMPGTTDGGGDNDDGSSGPSCSTCKLKVNKLTKCVLPGCYSADDGYLPFPDDGDYNFAEGCFYYNPDPSDPGKILPGMEGRDPGYYCPSITKGGSFDAGGGDGDPCYTKQDSIPDTANPNAPNYSLDYAKFVKMTKACSNDKPKSKRNFVPGKDAPIDDNDMPPPRNTKHQAASKTSATASTINHQHQHSGSINVYHHQGQQGKQGNSNNSNNSNSSNTYMDPVGDTTVLGYL